MRPFRQMQTLLHTADRDRPEARRYENDGKFTKVIKKVNV